LKLAITDMERTSTTCGGKAEQRTWPHQKGRENIALPGQCVKNGGGVRGTHWENMNDDREAPDDKREMGEPIHQDSSGWQAKPIPSPQNEKLA